MPPSSRKASATAAAAPDRATLLEEHVRFELSRWTSAALEASLREEIDALFDWLAGVDVGQLLPAQATARTVADALDQVEVNEEVIALAVETVVSARTALLASDDTVFDAVTAQDLHDLVDLLSGMDELRARTLAAVTDNSAYHEFVAHVLYHGVKAFMLSENVLARRVPGAQSLIRLGQRGLNSAAPGLEANVDRQLRRFVQAQIGDTLSDSKRFLDQTLTGDSAHELLDTILRPLGPTPLRDLAVAIDSDDLAALTEQLAPIVRGILVSGLAGRVVAPAVERVLTAYADCGVGALLADLGVEPDALARQLAAAVRPAVEHADATGFLEERIRARLGAFYQSDACSISRR